ncbi:DUF4340 domain-containing protein [Candidatus Electronema sp. TJ]|uniref:DUF4340 domain-containing protein n=1 Tax=Candidatus Electronema sp. TJ TaxID=3401573 RepID=UPI003AA7FBF5
MLKRVITFAAVLLAAQIGLTVFVHLRSGSGLNAAPPDALFLSFDPAKVTTVVISAGDGKTLTIEKNGAAWLMREAQSAPAESGQVEDLLRKAAAAKQGLAVAATKEAARRFKTAEDQFERHVVFKAGNAAAADFYLGGVAGFRQSYARAAGRDEVFSIPLSGYETEADPDKWLDKSLGRLKRDELAKITLADIVLVRQDKDWKLEGGEADPAKLAKALDQLTGLNVLAVLDPAKAAPLFQQAPTLQFTATKNGGETVAFALAKQDDHYVLKLSSSALHFKIGSWQAEELLKLKRAELLTKAAAP